MEDAFWNLFRETGDPMGYLLYKAEKNRKESNPDKTAPAPQPQPPTPPASA